jgi:hypothetical protein
MQTQRCQLIRTSLRVIGSILLVMFLAGVSLGTRPPSSAKSTAASRIPLKRLSPVGWFTMLVPANSPVMATKADIDGGFFGGSPIRVDFSYYAYVNTPNFLIDGSTGRPYAEARRPAPGTRKTRIGGRRGWIKTLSEDRQGDGYRFGSYLEFFNLPVSIGDGRMFPGTIRFEISTNNPRCLGAVRRIVQSIRLYQKSQPN